MSGVWRCRRGPAKSEESESSEDGGRENAIGSKESEESEDLGPMFRILEKPAALAKSEESELSEDGGRENAVGSKESEESKDLGPMVRILEVPARTDLRNPIRGISGQIGTTQRRLAWPSAQG